MPHLLDRGTDEPDDPPGVHSLGIEVRHAFLGLSGDQLIVAPGLVHKRVGLNKEG